MHTKAIKKKVIILGIDAMDPAITEQLIQEGKLPNLSNLRKTGSYSRLTTSVPAESVVAWTSFSTGLNPAGHGVFDFIMRDRRYLPYLSLNEISTVGGKTKIQIRKKGEALWDILSRNRIPSFIYFCPNTFPPDALLGKMLSGMGTPDILGTMGKFTFYATKALSAEDLDSRGRIIQVEPEKDVIYSDIYGPKISFGTSQSELSIPIKIVLKPEEDKAQLQFQGNSFFLKKGSWSQWQRVYFKIGFFKKSYGIVKFYLKSITPDFELYASPINFDPSRPLFPVSYPRNYSKKLVNKVGLYYTQGMPHDTWALTENRLDEKAFLEQVDEILNEKERILKEELKNFNGGLFFFYFDTLDIIQHMFWRYLDPRHVFYEDNTSYRDTIAKYYEKIDSLIGEVIRGSDKDATLIVMSDHGFGPFRRAVHLNRWLLENGYLFLTEGIKESKEFFEDVDWSRTKAYALGFGGVYLNRIGREYSGIVSASEVGVLKRSIAEGLKKLRDPKTAEIVVNNVYLQEDIFKGPYANDAPDLVVGFNKGFRASWQTALGGVPNSLIEDNRRKWSGDHLIDPVLVPGVIFVNRKAALDNPSIIDIAPEVLGLFGINKSGEMRGKVLFKERGR